MEAPASRDVEGAVCFRKSWDPCARSKNTDLLFFGVCVCSIFMVYFQPSALFTFETVIVSFC